MKNCTQILLANHQSPDKNFTASKIKRSLSVFQKTFLPLVFLFSFIASSSAVSAQLGVYNFTGTGACPNQNPAVTTQPSNAVFSNFSNTNTTCAATTDQFVSIGWNTGNSIDLTRYNEFTITPVLNYGLTLTSLSFTHSVDENGGGSGSGNTAWILRSSIDNYTTNIATGSANTGVQTPVVTLPLGSFTNIGAVTFRLYIAEIKRNTTAWNIDDVTLNGSVVLLPVVPANPTSNSPQCSNPGVDLAASGTAPAGETWYWQTSTTGTSIANSGSTFTVTSSGTYYIRSQDNTTLAWSNGAGSITVTITPDVGTPVFTLGVTSVRCQGAGSVTYSATATDATGITYSLDAASVTGGNTINSTTGVVTYAAGWNGTSTITAIAVGCNVPRTSTHTATITPTAGTPVFTLGATSTRCQGAGTVTYTATATNTTGITYSLDATTNAFAGNSINTSTGAVTYAAGWSGTSTITASAAGCNGPRTSNHTVTNTPTVGTPVFTSGTSSTRCQGAGTVTYTTTATNNTGITYSLDAASITGGNTINSATGAVTYAAGWSGTSTITASAAGCNGPVTSIHSVTITPTVSLPTFTSGATSTRCQGAATVTYTATATNTTGITYSLDATTNAFAGNSINTSTGAVTYAAGWSGTSTITASAAGCNGPRTSNHTVTNTPTVGTPVFTSGTSSTRCQGAGTVSYTATATNNTGITYSLDAASITGGNTINSSTGAVTYVAGWTGTSTISANATGCNGPSTSAHTVTITATVGLPVFTAGTTSTRCQGTGTVIYTATATTTTGITYSLDAASVTGGNSINSSTGAVTYVAGWSGTSTITASAAGCGGPRTATHTVTVTPTVGLPVFTLGATSTRCQVAGTITYTATATNNTGITYSLDAASITGGNTINTATGAVTYVAGWTGTSTITASATGCNGPRTSIHTVTITSTVGTPIFSLGATSIRCQGAATVSYFATATNSTAITYTLDATTDAFAGNSINTSTGAVTYAAGWSGISTITASAVGCNGPTTSVHTVTITPTVGLPVFTFGATSTRCQGAGTLTYTATATTTTGITYSLDAASITGGNSINSSTGAVTYVAGWSGTSIITASAAGCNGPRTSTHTVTVTPTVGTPVFTFGTSSTRCQGAGSVTYTATATNNTGITYSLDAASITGSNSINAATGAVTYAAGWTGTSTITANATGCNGPSTSAHTVTITATVGLPVFTSGTTSTRCQGTGTVTYTATATTTTGITYSLDAASITGGNSINSSTGAVTYVAGWSGTSTITASAAGCGGPRTAIHTVTITPTVGTPIFTLGASTTRCQGAGTVIYTATATNNTGITYSLDATSITSGNTINATTGFVTYDPGWSGTSTITATATGCNGPRTSNHIVAVTATVSTPVFTLGVTSTRCQGAGSVTYTSTAANSTGITYSLNAASITGGNTINSSTGAVSFSAGWSGTSIITATAAGCNGPMTSTHTVTITPTVGTPVFTLGATSGRCIGAGTITYTATATSSTGRTYTLDAASLAAGNTINTTTGAVTYTAAWASASTITVSAAGCNGPRTATHTVSITPNVGTPVFAFGLVSSRTQGAGALTYTATATNTTGITYSLDAASITGGNTINSATGAVTYTATWSGTTSITASAAGCNGPRTATHIVTITSTSVIKQLYLSDPSQALDRVDPVATADATTATTATLSSTGTTSATFTMAPVLCGDLTIKAGTITVRNFVTIVSGTMPANPNMTAVLRYGATNIITLTNPTFSSGLLTWTGTLGADVNITAAQAIVLQVTTAQSGVTFRIDFDSQTKPSRIDMRVSTFINVTSMNVFTAAYPGGSPVSAGTGGTTKYIRATVTDPFGTNDITAMNITITPTGSTVAATSVATSGCTRTYEYVWNTPATSGTYVINGTAKEGYENTVTSSRNIIYDVCTLCAPVAVRDSASGAGGNPIVIDVLSNDYDPNNNINNASLNILTQPQNGSAYISNNTVIYLPNGAFSGRDTLTYQICDFSTPTPLCGTAQVFLNIDPLTIDICADASKPHTYYIPYPEQQSYTALVASSSDVIPSNNIRTIISIKVPYPGMRIVWDEWEDGYEANSLNPIQNTTKVWGDGDIYNGIAPGYPTDIIPAGGGIILDNTMVANPRNSSTIFYDGRDKIVSNGQIAVTQVSGEPTWMPVQAIKTNVTSTYDFGQSFTIPLGQDFNSRDFDYTALFIRASENNTIVNIDKDNNGTLETTSTLNEGQSYLVNGGVLTGATVTSNKPVGVELNAGGIDTYSIRNAPIFPATWYSNTYYTPVPTSDNAGDNPKDSSVVMLYNSLSFKTLTINWYSGAPASGTISIPPKTAVRFPLAYSATAGYKFVNPSGESFTAIEIVDSYTPGGGGNDGQTYDWSFNLISESRLTDYATVAWAPGGLDLVAPPGPDVNGNPIWVTPSTNTTIYVKYNGDVSGTSGLVSPCGLRYDVSYTLNALNYIKIKDPSDNDQSGIAIYTCNGAKIAAVYGEDPQGSGTGIGVAFWDVGSTIQPFCKQKLVIATDDYTTTLVGQPVTISILDNDFGFLATIDPATVSTIGLLQPSRGTVSINANGTVIYRPNAGYTGLDTFEYRVCSTPSPIVCDMATVIIRIGACPSNSNQNIVSGMAFLDINKDGVNNDGGSVFVGAKIYLYADGNCNGIINTNELVDSVTVGSSGYYQFTRYPEKILEDDFDGTGGVSTCASGTDGDSPWASNWVDAGDPSTGYCNTSQSAANTDAEIVKDGAFSFGLRLKDNNVSATRSVNLSGATKAFLTFDYRRKTALSSGEDVLVQAYNGTTYTTIFTIAGNGAVDANYVTVYNQELTPYVNANSAIRFLTNNNVDDNDTLYIDNVKIQFLKYNQCYITQLDPSTIPATYYNTTVAQRTSSFANGATCSTQFDFGIAKSSVSISGTLLNDNNGLVDATVNGPFIATPGGATVYAYLTDVTGRIAFKTTVNPVNGQYSFPLADVNTDYTVVLSVVDSALFTIAPATFGLSNIWIPTGDNYGTNNGAGTGIKSGTPVVRIDVRTNATNVTNVNFGIERLPDSYPHLTSINHPYINQVITLDGGMNPPVLTGIDPEDYPGGGVLTSRRVRIDTIPDNAELYYNGVLLTNGYTIASFNPSLLSVKVTTATIGDSTISFRYSYIDAALMKDPTPALYTLIWFWLLPAEGLVAVANLNGDNAIIKWSTLSENNTNYFVVERSVNNVNYTATGFQVAAAKNSTVKKEYQLQDNISSLTQYPVVYYRVKLYDIDGKSKYSNIVSVRLSQKPGVIIWPNPFQSSINISITIEKATTIDVNLIDVSGRSIKRTTQSADKGITRITVTNLEQLPAGIYLVEITDKNAGTTYQKLLKNER